MKVLILAPGTRGDVAPAARLGSGFVADGHEATIVAGAEYAALVHDAGCAHAPISAAMALSDPAAGAAGVRQYLAHLRVYMRSAADAALAAMDGAGAVLTNPISPYGHDIAEHLGVASAAALLQPAHPSAAYPPMIASSKDLGPRGNRLAGRGAQRVPTPYDPATAHVRATLGMSKERPAAARRRRRALPVHHGISAAVLPRPADWPASHTLDGFWWPLEPRGWAPEADLADFLDAGPAPVLVALGSLDAGASFTDALVSAVSTTSSRVILQGNVFGEHANEFGDRVLHVGDVPHSWLLPRVSAVVHQAGAGITAATLRAGVPSVALPLHTDQPFWARRLQALGAAVEPIPAKRVTAESVGAAIVRVTSSDDFTLAARGVRDRLESGDSTAPLRRWVNELHG